MHTGTVEPHLLPPGPTTQVSRSSVWSCISVVTHPLQRSCVQLCLLPSLPTSKPGQGQSPLGALADTHCIALGISKAAGSDPPRHNSRPSHMFPTTLSATDAGTLREWCCGHEASHEAFTFLLSAQRARVTHPQLPGAQGTLCWGGDTSHTNKKAQGTASSGIITCNKSKPLSVFSLYKQLPEEETLEESTMTHREPREASPTGAPQPGSYTATGLSPRGKRWHFAPRGRRRAGRRRATHARWILSHTEISYQESAAGS